MQEWVTGAKRRMVVGAFVVFGMFSLLAQATNGLDMTISPVRLAAQQPVALLQTVIGCLLGGFVGSRFGRGVWRQLAHAPDRRDLYTWWPVLLWIWPWVLLVIMNLQAYRPSYGESVALEAWLIHLFPLTLGFKQTFPFALAAGYFVGTRAGEAAP